MTTDEQRLVAQARAMIDAGRPAQAEEITREAVVSKTAGHGLIAARASALKALGRLDESLDLSQRAARSWPDSGVAWHNVAAALGDLGRHAEAIQAVAKARKVGLDVAATWLVAARAERGLRRSDAAIDAYRGALARDPLLIDAVQELCQVLWMSRRDLEGGLAALDVAERAGATPSRIHLARFRLMEVAGKADEGRARAIAAAHRLPQDLDLNLLGVQAAVQAGAVDDALTFAAKGLSLSPRGLQSNIHQTIALMAAGRAPEAVEAAERATRVSPDAQDAWGWLATAARAAGDARAEPLLDYDTLVRPYTLSAPDGWSDSAAFLSDLAAELDALHDGLDTPYDQSVRGGSQTDGDLTTATSPAIRAFHAALHEPIEAYMQAVGSGSDPLRRRNSGRYALSGSWSVRLRRGGHHTDHFHPEGWLSSAFYVRLPEAAIDHGREGWIRFSRPPFPTIPDLPAEHWVRPEAGRLVLFPSYMWHGTEPFESDETRLTIAFDVVPA